MAQSFYASISPAGYPQFPDLVIVTPLSGFTPGSPPGRPVPGPTPPGGPVDPGYSPPWAQLPVDPGYGIPERPPYPSQGPGFPTHPIVLPDPLPPSLPGVIVPPPGEPGSITKPYPPGEVPPHPATGKEKFYVVQPTVGVSGPYQMMPDGTIVPATPPPAGGTPPPAGGTPPQAPRSGR